MDIKGENKCHICNENISWWARIRNPYSNMSYVNSGIQADQIVAVNSVYHLLVKR
jgi:hypothetical protein